MKTYYNTNNESGQTLAKSKDTAKYQQNVILEFFKRNPKQSYTPCEVLVFCFPKHQHFEQYVPITSVRRAMTNLTIKGELEKTGVMKIGMFGKNVHTWKIR